MPRVSYTWQRRATPSVFGFLGHDVDVHGGRLAEEAVHGGEMKVFPPVTQGSPSKDDLRNVLGANKSGHGVRNAFSCQANHFRAQAVCEAQVARQRVCVGLAMEGSKLAVDVDHV